MTSDTNQLRAITSVHRAPSRTFSLRLPHLRWLATLIPAAAVFTYESIRHQVIDHHLHVSEFYGNLVTGALALVLCYFFARVIFNRVEWIQIQAVEETRTAAALNSMVAERERISRELHDGLAQVLSYVLVRLDTVRILVEEGKAADATSELEALRSAVDNVNVDVRESIAGLRSRVVERGLVEALRDYLEEYEERYGILTELRATGDPLRLAPNADLQLFRVVQEALTNARKHAAAAQVRVGISWEHGGLDLAIADDGTGFDVDRATGDRSFGLAGMRERVATLGGECLVKSTPGKGTTVSIAVPAGGLVR